MAIDACSVQNVHTFSVKLSVFKNATSATVFSIKSPNFQCQLTLTGSFHFWHLQMLTSGFQKCEKGLLLVSVNQISVCCVKCAFHLGEFGLVDHFPLSQN